MRCQELNLPPARAGFGLSKPAFSNRDHIARGKFKGFAVFGRKFSGVYFQGFLRTWSCALDRHAALIGQAGKAAGQADGLQQSEVLPGRKIVRPGLATWPRMVNLRAA